MKRKSPSYKYQCDNKLKIYSESPINTSQYYRKINNAKPRYLNDYYKAPRYNGKREDKNFNGILNKYYNDYNKIKNKYNVIEDESVEEEYANYNRFDYNEYENRKANINYLFFSYDSPEIDENTFDLTDTLVNDMYNGNEDTLLKNTQIKSDYDKRLDEENELRAPSNQPTLSNYVNEKLDDENENEPPVYDDDKNKKEEEKKENESKIDDKKNENDIINEEKENDNDNEVDNIDKKSLRESEKNNKKEDEEYILMLENNNQNNDDELMMFRDIISSDFRKYYNPPYYKIPEYILKEIEKEKEEKIEKKEEYEKYKDHNIVNKDEDGNIKKLENIIKEDNKNPQLDQIIDPYDKNEYPPQNPEIKEEEKEKEKKNENNDSEYEGGFEPVDDEESKRNTVQNIINKDGEDYNIKENKISEEKGKKEEENQNQKEEMKGQYVNLDNYNGNDYPTVGEMVNKNYQEKNENEKNDNNGKQLKKSVKYREERFESIPVDDIEDEIDYGDFE